MRNVLLCALLLAGSAAAIPVGSVPEWVELPEGTLYLTGLSPELSSGVAFCDAASYQMFDQPRGSNAAMARASPAEDCITSFTWRAPADFALRSDLALDLVVSCDVPLLALGNSVLRVAAATITLERDDGAGSATLSTIPVYDVLSCVPGTDLAFTLPVPVALPDRAVEAGDVLALRIAANWLSFGAGEVDPVPKAHVVVGPDGSKLRGFGLPADIEGNAPPMGRVTVTEVARAPFESGTPCLGTITPVRVSLRVEVFDLEGDLSGFALQHRHGGGVITDLVNLVPPTMGQAGEHVTTPHFCRSEDGGVHRITMMLESTVASTTGPVVQEVNLATAYFLEGRTIQQLPDPHAGAADSDPDPTGKKDGIPDHLDNCPTTYNPHQSDFDRDGVGDACDADLDGDDVLDFVVISGQSRQLDNCLRLANDQSDVDGDGLGDACDEDMDNDTILNARDNCIKVANKDQADRDGDLIGDACDGDADGDGTADDVDVCPSMPNLDQSDIDGDGLGDVCDDDIDGDKLVEADNCPRQYNPQQHDLDGDGIGDECDADVDGDGRIDNLDADIAFGPAGPVESESLFGFEDKDVPGPGMLVLVALVGLALLRRK